MDQAELQLKYGAWVVGPILCEELNKPTPKDNLLVVDKKIFQIPYGVHQFWACEAGSLIRHKIRFYRCNYLDLTPWEDLSHKMYLMMDNNAVGKLSKLLTMEGQLDSP